MADRSESIPLPRRTSWENQPAFRENFLSFIQADRRDAFRQLGDLFFTVLLDSPYAEHDRTDQLRGLAADVGAVSAVLDGLVRDLGEEMVFPQLLAGWSTRLAAIRDEISSALDGGGGEG